MRSTTPLTNNNPKNNPINNLKNKAKNNAKTNAKRSAMLLEEAEQMLKDLGETRILPIETKTETVFQILNEKREEFGGKSLQVGPSHCK